MKYTIHILMIKLWEWEGVADKWNTEIIKNGPEQEMCNYYKVAIEHVTELKAAIKVLTPNSSTH